MALDRCLTHRKPCPPIPAPGLSTPRPLPPAAAEVLSRPRISPGLRSGAIAFPGVRLACFGFRSGLEFLGSWCRSGGGMQAPSARRGPKGGGGAGLSGLPLLVGGSLRHKQLYIKRRPTKGR